MEIIRTIGGVVFTFELTAEELGKAFREQDREYHIEDIHTQLNDEHNDYSEEQKNFVAKNITTVVGLYEDQLDEGAFWTDAADMAINEILHTRKDVAS